MITALDDAEHVGYMRRCIELARTAHESGDTPVGSLIVRNGEVVAEGVEAVHARRDVTAHAEIEALRAACERFGATDLTGCVLYTTVDPCPMCAYAIRLARVSVVVTGTPPEGAATEWSGCGLLADALVLPSRPVPVLVRGVLAAECRAALVDVR